MLQAPIELFKRTMNEWLIRNVSWAQRYLYYKKKDYLFLSKLGALYLFFLSLLACLELMDNVK